MAITNSICIKQCSCNKFTITDTSDWDGLDLTNNTPAEASAIIEVTDQPQLNDNIYVKVKGPTGTIWSLQWNFGPNPGQTPIGATVGDTVDNMISEMQTQLAAVNITEIECVSGGTNMIAFYTTVNTARYNDNTSFTILDTENFLTLISGKYGPGITGSNYYMIGGISAKSTSIILYDDEDVVVDSFTSAEYTDSNEFTTTTTFPDGEYRVLVTYVIEDEEYVIEDFVYNVCNIKCKKEQLIRDLALEDGCISCKDEKLKLALEASILFQALCAAIICKNTSEADKLLAWLEDKLINYKCKSC